MPRLKKRADGRYQRRKTINGKSVLFYGKTVQEIDEKIAAYELRVNHPATFREIAEAWYNDKWDTFAPGTQNGYRGSYNRALAEFDGMLAADVTPQDVNRLLALLISQKYSGKMIKTQKAVISTIYKHANVNGARLPNPATEVPIPRGLPKTTREPPSDDEINKVIQTSDPWLFPKILLFLGLRKGEALALEYEDFDFQNSVVHINKEIINKGNTNILVYRTKTQAGTRDVDLPEALAVLIPRNKHGRIFDYTYSQFRKAWWDWCDRVGVHFTPHQLRHGYASLCVYAGVTVKELQSLLGHADTQTTQNIYTHFLERQKTERRSKINTLFSQLSSQENSQNAQ